MLETVAETVGAPQKRLGHEYTFTSPWRPLALPRHSLGLPDLPRRRSWAISSLPMPLRPSRPSRRSLAFADTGRGCVAGLERRV